MMGTSPYNQGPRAPHVAEKGKCGHVVTRYCNVPSRSVGILGYPVHRLHCPCPVASHQSTSTLVSTSTMPQVPSNAIATSSSTPSPEFETVFRAALEAYQNRTKSDIASHPLATQLQSCDSSGDIIALLRAQVHAFDHSQSSDEKWTKWLDPTVNVLYAFSAALGSGVGMVN